jgi:hypothetical protein
MKAAAICSALVALIANSEIVTVFLLLCWAGVLLFRIYAAAEERRG